MIDKQSLIRWLKGADEIFEALEGRGDAYNLCRKWVEGWVGCGKFCITDDDKEFLKEFELLIFNEKVKSRIEDDLAQLKKEIGNHTKEITFAFSLYLISWNIRGFETYFERNSDFNFGNFFVSLNEMFNQECLEVLKKLRKFHLLKDEIKSNLVMDIYEKLHQKLKAIGTGTQNEPVSTIKIMHIVTPFYIPLLDNPIAEALKKEKVCEFFSYRQGRYRGIEIDPDSLIKYMAWIKEKFSSFSDAILSLELEKRKSFLKLLDQAFYIRYSIDIGRRLK